MKKEVYVLIEKKAEHLYAELHKEMFVVSNISMFLKKKQDEYNINDLHYYNAEELIDLINRDSIDLSKYKIANVTFEIVPNIQIYNVVRQQTCVDDVPTSYVIGSFTDFDDAFNVLENDYNSALDSMIDCYGKDYIEISDNGSHRALYAPQDSETYAIGIQEVTLNVKQ